MAKQGVRSAELAFLANKEGLSEAMHLMPAGSAHAFSPIMYHPACAFRLISTAAETKPRR